MPLTSFCGLLTLQVGISVLSGIFFTLAALILAANIFDYNNNSDGWPVSLLLMIIFVIFLIVAGVTMFSSSYSENRSLAMVSLVVIIVALCYWIILCCFSFVSNPNHIQAICIDIRCPESFWIANLGYRNPNKTDDNQKKTDDKKKPENDHQTQSVPNTKKKRFAEDYDNQIGITTEHIPANHLYQYNAEYFNDETENHSEENHEKTSTLNKKEESTLGINKLNETTLPSTWNDMYKNRQFYFLDDSPESPSKKETNDTNKENDKKGNKDDKENESRYNVGFPLVGAVFLFVINFIFLLFSALAMWSWASELDWADYIIEDEPVVIYEDAY